MFWFDLFLEDRAKILQKISLVFCEIWRHQKDILKITDLWFLRFPTFLVINISHANKWMRKKISTCTNSALNMYNFLNVIQNTYCLFILIQQAKLIYDSFRINWIFFKVDNRSLSACTFAEHLSKKNWISISRILSYIET